MALGLRELAGEACPHAAPGQPRVPVERLLELRRDPLELRMPLARMLELAELGEVVEQPVAAEGSQLGILQLAGHGDHLLPDPPTFGGMLDVQQRGVATEQ